MIRNVIAIGFSIYNNHIIRHVIVHSSLCTYALNKAFLIWCGLRQKTGCGCVYQIFVVTLCAICTNSPKRVINRYIAI